MDFPFSAFVELKNVISRVKNPDAGTLEAIGSILLWSAQLFRSNPKVFSANTDAAAPSADVDDATAFAFCCDLEAAANDPDTKLLAASPEAAGVAGKFDPAKVKGLLAWIVKKLLPIVIPMII